MLKVAGELGQASLAQQGVWITERSGEAGTAFHMPVALRFDGRLDVRALLDACGAVVARHPVLAAAVRELDGVPDLVGAPVAPPVVVEDLTAVPDGERDERLARRVRDEVTRGFDLRTGPLVRFTLFAVAPERHLLLVVAHHLVFDGQSKDVLVGDLAAGYRARVEGHEAPPEPTTPHAEHAAAERAQVAAQLPAAAAFWADRWAAGDPAAVTLPGPAGPVQAGGAAAGAVVEAAVDQQTWHDAAAAAEAIGVTPFELLLAALHALLHRYGNPAPAVAVDLGTRTPETGGQIGLFVNELPVVAAPSPAMTVRELALAVRAEVRWLNRFRSVPLARAVPGGTISRTGPRAALAPVSLSYRRRGPEPEFPGLAVSVDWTMFNHVARNALHVQVVDGPGQVDVSLQYPTGTLDRGDVLRVAGHLRALLAAAASAPDTRLADVALEPEDGPAMVAPAPPGDPASTLVDLFETQVRARPGAVAVVAADRTLTYAELDAAAGRLADRLRGQGVGAQTLVALWLDRSVDLLVALLAVHKAGGAYLPLDPAHPADRLAFVLDDAAAPLVLTRQRLAGSVPGAGRAVLIVDGAGTDGPDAGGRPVAGPAPRPVPGDLAYVIYTSGSTGRPKGVEVEHGSLRNLLLAMRGELDAGAADVWLGLTTLSFDIAALELFLPLVTGGRVVVAPEAAGRDGAAGLPALIRDHGVTHVQATPSGWRLLLAAGFHDPGVVALAGGEPLDPPLARDLHGRVRRLVNVYGPTETTVWSTISEVAAPVDAVTIGRPIGGTSVWLLGANGLRLPAGMAGELHLGGAGVARGYRGRAALTAERFMPDPDGPPGSRRYGTGDLVRVRGGELEFLGRIDNQIKIRGHRVELGEIEARLLEHPQVGQAVVVLRDGGDGDARLAAYVVPAGTATPDPAALHAQLATTLPRHMLPAAYGVLDDLPLTPNGKLDRAALPEPAPPRGEPEAVTADGAAPADTGGPATSEVLEEVAEIWREVLQIDDIRPGEDLFDLGGHSLTITQIIARIRTRLDVEVPLDVFFDAPTILGVADAITEIRRPR